MRQKQVIPRTEVKYIAFLNDLKLKCDGTLKGYSTTQLQRKQGISKSAFSACKELGIVSQENGVLKWISESEPDRKMALEVLNHLLERNPSTLKVPYFDGFGDLLSSVRELTTTMGTYVTQHEKERTGAKISLNEKHLFSSDDQDKDVYLKILLVVATGHYGNYDFITPYQNTNSVFIDAAKDLHLKFKQLQF